MLIKRHFRSKLYQCYIHKIFQNKKNSDYVLYSTKKDSQNFEKSFRKLVINVCDFWLFNILNCRDNSNGYVAYKSVLKQKLRPRTKEMKMSLTIKELLEYYSIRIKV